MTLEDLAYLERTIHRTEKRTQELQVLYKSLPDKSTLAKGEFRVEFCTASHKWISCLSLRVPDPADSINLIVDKEEDWALLSIWKDCITSSIDAYEKRIAEMRAHLKVKLLEYIEEV